MEQARAVEEKVKLHCHVWGESPYPNGLQASRVKGTCAQEVAQRVVPSNEEQV